MSERSITRRNFWGGFWGGILGILAVGWIHAIALPLGCLVGVVAGFWYQEIGQITYQCFREYLLRLLVARRRVTRKLHGTKASIYRGFRGAWIATSRGACIGTRSTIEYCLSKLHILINWLNRSYDQDLVARRCAVILFGGINIGISLFAIVYTVHGRDGISSVASLLWLAFGFFMAFMPAAIVFYDRPHDVRHDELRAQGYDRYVRHGWWFCFGYDMLAMLRAEVAGVLSLLFAVIFWMAATTFVLVPVVATMLTLHGIYKIALRRQHWVCLVVTLLVTAASACIGHAYLHNNTFWLVALVCGCLSGTVASVAHQYLVAFFKQHRRMRVLANMWFALVIKPVGQHLCRWQGTCLSLIDQSLVIEA